MKRSTPRRDNGQRYRAELEHGIVESADVEFETRSLPTLTRSFPRHFTFYAWRAVALAKVGR
jgi:hypothetical protein